MRDIERFPRETLDRLTGNASKGSVIEILSSVSAMNRGKNSKNEAITFHSLLDATFLLHPPHYLSSSWWGTLLEHPDLGQGSCRNEHLLRCCDLEILASANHHLGNNFRRILNHATIVSRFPLFFHQALIKGCSPWE